MASSRVLPESLRGQLDVLMIDNFDSFTWNLYQSLSLLGAQVTVIRNDAISTGQLSQLKIKYLIISPGPGHPKTDSGISNAAIQYFKGKVPVLGVCMGLECMVDSFGGKIGYAGEIMHGKVSRIRHDGRGCFRDVPQGIKSTRYHSLSASLSTIPDELAITATSQESGVIMGLRHRKFTMEAVQYHPESIMSEGGDAFLKNFLALKGSTWDQNPESRVLDPELPPFPTEVLPSSVDKNGPISSKAPSILDKIYAQRLVDVSKVQKTPGSTYADLETLLALNLAPPLISFVDRLKESGERVALLAEIKRASPSKGPIAVTTSPPAQALTYALAGANVISVLTEPHWFLGNLQDMYHARMSVAHLVNRPAILRKDFILSKYQIIEARIYGADTVLLIVSMLPEDLLKELYAFSVSLGMEPLVEVNNSREMEVALALNAKVIGVNNRNLHSFDVDMGTTSRLREMVTGRDVILCALSGISAKEDIDKYAQEGIKAVLIGESLMRAKDTASFIRQLFSIPEPASHEPVWRSSPPLVKICGIRTAEEAVAVALAGADFLGLVFAEKSRRRVDLDVAKSISRAIREARFDEQQAAAALDPGNTPWFTTHATRLSSGGNGPLLVGVFQNASLAEVLHTVSYVQLDLVQLHGTEPIEWAAQIPVPVIRAYHVGSDGSGLKNITRPGAHQFVLLDSMREDGSGVSGGSGKILDLSLAKRAVDAGEFVVQGEAAYMSPERDGEEEEEKSSENSASPPAEAAANGEEPAPRDHAANGVPAIETTPSPFSRYPLPIILAGGLTPDNIAGAVEQVRPWAVDVSGGVEAEDGLSKDLTKVEAFVQAVKSIGT